MTPFGRARQGGWCDGPKDGFNCPRLGPCLIAVDGRPVRVVRICLEHDMDDLRAAVDVARLASGDGKAATSLLDEDEATAAEVMLR